MKKMALVILVTINLHGVRLHELLKAAIQNGEVQKVSELIQQSNPKVKTERTPLRAKENIDLNQLHELAQELLAETKEASQNLKNRHVAKRILVSCATILSSWTPFGIVLYNGFTTNNWSSGEIIFGSITAGVAGTYHGIDQMQLGLSNEDAKINYAKYIAIVEITSKAKDETGATEIA